jgi:peptidoglycan hydrolase FlgJ
METKSALDKASLYHDLGSLNEIRSMAKGDKKEALSAVAKQFEAYFLNELLKNSRKTNEMINEDSLFNGKQVAFFQQMHDEQMATTMAKTSGFGIAELVVKQLDPQTKRPAKEFEVPQRSMSNATSTAVAGYQSHSLPITEQSFQVDSRRATSRPLAISNTSIAGISASRANEIQTPSIKDVSLKSSLSGTTSNPTNDLEKTNRVDDAKAILKPAAEVNPAGSAKATQSEAPELNFDSPEAFIESLLPYARKAAEMLGTSPRVLIAQAALETGWGQFVISDKEGKNSFNLFNIKSDQRWDGSEVAKQTLEFEQGVAVKKVENFRSYESYEQSFMDYADFVKNSERYQGAVSQASDEAKYIEALHQAGYATDPHYSDKVKSIMKSEAIQYIPD